jgi:YVTN family beta-propeller protein
LNRVTDQIDVGSTPTVIAAGADGVWVLNANEETVTRIDPDTRKAERTIGTRGTPTDLAVSKEAVWVVNRPADLVRIDSGSGTLVRRVEVPLAEPPPRFSIPVSAFVATSPDAIWVSANATVARVDPRSTRLTLRRAVALAAGEVAVGEGALWVGGLARLDTRTARLTGSTKLPFEPADVAVGGGAVWLANQESDTVWRVDPRELVVRRVVRVGEHPAALAFGEGSLWVASLDGTVSRIDPETNRVAETIRVGGTPRGIATGHGMVWVAVS